MKHSSHSSLFPIQRGRGDCGILVPLKTVVGVLEAGALGAAPAVVAVAVVAALRPGSTPAAAQSPAAAVAAATVVGAASASTVGGVAAL